MPDAIHHQRLTQRRLRDALEGRCKIAFPAWVGGRCVAIVLDIEGVTDLDQKPAQEPEEDERR